MSPLEKALPCKFAFADRVGAELHGLEQKGIISSEEEPSNGVNQMAVVETRSDKLRLHIDPNP